MPKHKFKQYYQVREIFTSGKHKQFKKGELYRDPRIQQQGGQKDFLIVKNKEDDYEMLRQYLGNELERYPSEPYNSFTTGLDAAGTPMIGLYWIDEHMEHVKTAIVLCQDGSEEEALAIVDEFCVEHGEMRPMDKLNMEAEAAAKTNVGQELVKAAVSQFQHPNLAKYNKTK